LDHVSSTAQISKIHYTVNTKIILEKFIQLGIKCSKPENYVSKEFYKTGEPISKYIDSEEREEICKIFTDTMAYIENNPQLFKISISIEEAINHLQKDLNSSVEDSPELHYWNYLKWMYEEYEGYDFDKLDFHSYQKEEALYGGNISFEDGYISMIEAMSKDLDIRLEHIVESIEDYDKENIVVKTKDGLVFTASYVVISVPLGVLKSKAISFVPSLPERKLTSINKLGMGLMNKIILQFRKPFWENTLFRAIHISDVKGEFPWIEVVSTEPPILLLWLACSYAEQIEKFSNEEIIHKAIEVIKKIFRDQVEDGFELVDYHITRWRADEFSRGSWSVRHVGAGLDDHAIVGEPVGSLYFCGEHTSDKYPGTVTGAFFTGEMNAELIVVKIASS
jgi:polyamine oxidase